VNEELEVGEHQLEDTKRITDTGSARELRTYTMVTLIGKQRSEPRRELDGLRSFRGS
jgi:hypothetical protein